MPITFESWLLFTLTEAALSLSPGPAVMLVCAFGLSNGWRHSLWATLGILAANAFYFVVSATGVGSLIMASYELFSIIKWAGAAYLVYLGLSAIFGKPSPLTVSRLERRDTSRWQTFRSAVTLQLANPKTLLFFVAILPQFVNPNAPVGLQMSIFAASSIIPEFLILLGYGILASQAARVATQPRFARMTDRIAGSLVLTAGILVASVKKQG
jgi:threonine/homoserine/homoserine lactone efflux protein